MMLSLQKEGCHNINLVTPSHVVPQILQALELAVLQGLHLPLVYNTGGYDSVETLRLLDGVIDIYMPDFKFWDGDIAETMGLPHDYPEKARNAIIEMHRQVGDLAMDETGIATRGLLLRHLVMPEGLAGTREIMRFIVRHISARTYVNLMSQYRPCAEAHTIPSIARAITTEEYDRALQEAAEEGILRFDQRRGRTFALI
jgi:putative pyruvate formate lyase activating enzyme